MTSIAKASPRERLLRAAAELFYREGITATGVERLCQEAGVSKRSMYQLFDTKDELVAESLAQHARATAEAYLPEDTADLTPRERILYVFERLDAGSADPSFGGCPFVGAATELKDPAHPARLLARGYKQRLTDYFADQATLAGAPDPETLAKQLTIVFDGAAARAVVHATGLDGLAALTASALLDAGGVPAFGRTVA
jgi:AcrR family transcriptional regulator